MNRLIVNRIVNLIVNGLSVLLLGLASATTAHAQPASNAYVVVFSTLNPDNPPAYPSGSRFYPDGTIRTPGGAVFFPSAIVPRGNDGAQTFFYRNGTHITTHPDAIDSAGASLILGNLKGHPKRQSQE
jgi:hypothetical protein